MSSGEVSHISSYCLDEKSFHLCCKLFLQHSGVIRDGWSWADVKGSEEGYMKKTAIIPAKLGSLLNHKADDGMNAVTGVDECDDEAVGDYIVQSQVLVHYEYHILYSIGHQVPILYFRASTLDGQPLSLDDVWSNIHPNYRQRLLQGPWDTLTQQEHPFLGQPFFMLHPCHTEEFMKPLLQMADDKKRLRSVGEKVQNPSASGGADTQFTELSDQYSGEDCIERGAKVNEQHSDKNKLHHNMAERGRACGGIGRASQLSHRIACS